MAKLSDIINILITIIIIITAIFMVFQLARVLLGRSWTVEDILISFTGIIITCLFVIVGYIISLSKSIGRIEANSENLKNSFCNLAKDFKSHCSK